MSFLCFYRISFRWFLYIISRVVSFLNFTSSRLMSKLVFHGGKVYGWTLISELSSTSYSLAYSVKSSMCLFAGLCRFLTMLAAYSGDLFIFLILGGVQILNIECFRWSLNEKLSRQILCLSYWKCILGGLVWLIGRLLHHSPFLF